MSQLTVISRQQHAAKRWKRYSSYSFVAGEAIAPLVAQELPRACMSLPLAFVKQGDDFVLVAVLGLKAGENLLVGADGRWLAGYVPSAFRGHPFVLANTDDGRRALCVREDSGLVSDTEGEPFFEENGEPGKLVKNVLSFLEQVSDNAKHTAGLCALLARHELIQPWDIQLKANEAEQKVQGLYRVNEEALNALPAEAFASLRAGGALSMAYCQLLSMQHLQRLGHLARMRAETQTGQPAASGDLDLEFLRDDDTLRFS